MTRLHAQKWHKLEQKIIQRHTRPATLDGSQDPIEEIALSTNPSCDTLVTLQDRGSSKIHLALGLIPNGNKNLISGH